MNLGPAEVAVILLLALLVFGPARLPEIGRQVGAAMRELRRMQSTLRRELDEAMREEPAPPVPAPPMAGLPVAGEPDHTDVEPDHTDVTASPTSRPSEPGFEGPPGSFI